MDLSVYSHNLLIAAVAVCAGVVLSFTLRKAFLFFSKFWLTFIISSIVRNLQGPVNFLLPILCLNAALPLMEISVTHLLLINKISEIVLTVLAALVLIRIIKVLEDYFY